MSDAYYTETGPRPELAALEVNPVEGFIGERIFPIVPVMQKTSYVYYRTITADSAAQTTRTTLTAPDATGLTGTSTTYTCTEAIKRASISPEEVKTYGGIQACDKYGSKWAKRQVMRAKEAAIVTLVLGTRTVDTTFDAGKMQLQIQTAIDAISLYSGKTALITSTKVLRGIWLAMLKDNALGASVARIVTGGNSISAAQGLGLESIKAALAMTFGVDEILCGKTDLWNATAVAGRFCVAKLDDSGDPMSQLTDAVLGKCFQFMPDGTNPWYIESIADRLNKANHWDAQMWYQAKTFNSDAMYLVDGVPTA
jgi:hypothetical protein